ncbi:outer membrane receptor protein involved in Fe transport [Novosphingobium sp. SG751A]|uniref:TonB-dependent receptor domain-containing protein n=1 Tax=Novosphingobium sp. SG751A TaxID=2587000 RepID=UPI0015563B88|nr:TonB-dependent receptor [Novosphingobium sp. SG751A]NOW48431.1 outer membrane receptor protein involved in Fe transport [Novosphingobium sp. SG751A]
MERHILLAALYASAAAVTAPAMAQTRNNERATNEEIIVTGVLRDTMASKAPISSTTVGEEKIQTTVPLSAADLLTEIPGVVVNSDAGEAKATVFARGLSNGTDASTYGYYWTTMMEDGLPLTPAPYSNFQPDMFLRADVTIKRVQAVRGGSAAITGPNAPAGLFNYISKNGMTDPGGQVIVRLGNEGDGNLYQKYDAYYGWHNDDKTLAWSVGGDYRHGYGYRSIAYPMNYGGQIKANMNYSYNSDWGSGGLLVSFKYLDDHTGTNDTFRPITIGFNDPQFLPGFGRDVNYLPTGDLAHTVPFGSDGSRNWDPSNFSHEKSFAGTIKWDHTFNNGLKLSNNLRIQNNSVEHTYATDFAYQSLLNSATWTTMGTAAAGLSNTPGYFTLTNRSTGQVLARVYRITSASQNGVCVTAVTNGYCMDRNTPNLLPNQTLVNQAPIDSSNLILMTGTSNSSGIINSRDITDLFTLTKDFGKVTITAGVYFNQTSFSRDFAYGGRAILPLQNQPTTLGVAFTTTTTSTAGGAAGTTYQITDPTGYGALGSSVGLTLRDRAHVREISPLLGITWEANSHLLLDAGARLTMYRGWGENNRFVTNPNAATRSFGGVDGTATTIYDNVYAVDTAAGHFPFDKSITYAQFTGAASYLFSPRFSMFARFTLGKKNNDAFWDGFNVAQNLVDQFSLAPLPTLKSAELSFQWRNRWLQFNPVFYFTDLNNVPVRRNDGFLADGVTRYTTPPFMAHYQSYGIELDNTVRVAKWLNFRNVLTVQRSLSLSFPSISLGTCNGVPTATTCPGGIQPQDDDTATYSSGPQPLAADLVYNGTANLRFGRFGAYYRFRYIGSRPVTIRNTFRLAPQKLSDMGVTYNVNDRLTLQFNVNNLFNDASPTKVGTVGTIPSNMTEADFIAQYPNALSTVQVNAPRSFFFTASARF